jgi:phage terminase large subunit-like protein
MESSFRAYVLNQPVQADDRFIAPGDWDACSGDAEARGPCYGGLDLSSGAADLTAFSLHWPETGLLRVWAFLPALKLDEKAREDRAPYRDWQARGLVIEMPGRAIDRPWLLTWIAQQVDGLELAGIACDRWGLSDVQAVLDREGLHLPLKPHGAGYRDMAPAITAFEALVLDGKLRHGGNPLLRWAVANAAVDMDPAGNRKLSKESARGRIDPLVAAVSAVGIAAREPPAQTFENVGWLAV